MGMQIKNLTPREAEVYLFDEIGYWGDTAGDVVDTLRDLDVDHIAVKINSPGGDVFDGIAIMNILKSHPAKVTTVVEGLAASAASFIAVGAGDEVVMMPHSQLMIHDAWGMSMGNAEDMMRCAEELNRASDNLAAIYRPRPVGMWGIGGTRCGRNPGSALMRLWKPGWLIVSSRASGRIPKPWRLWGGSA